MKRILTILISTIYYSVESIEGETSGSPGRKKEGSL